MEEREVITLGFGNYSSLVAAQWVNGTSRYDVHHSTLYHERHLESVLGGECLYNTGNNNDDDDGSNEESEERTVVGTHSIVHVPRLLLLDAPHASYFTELAHDTYTESSNDSCNEDGKDVEHGNSNRKVVHADTLVREARRQWWNGKHSPLNQEEEEEEEEEDSNYDDDDDDDESKSYRNRQNYHVDPYHVEEEEQEEESQYTSTSQQVNTSNNISSKKTNKKLFKTHDTVVPWWRYITTGLDVHAITTLRPLHNTIDTGSEIASLHSVGYGLAHFAPNNSHAMEMEQFTDALRHELEECDQVQGTQCFIDSDSCFAGAACNVLTELAQDVGSKTPMALFALFQPSPFALASSGKDSAHTIPFAERRSDETHLNRLLSTTMLSSSSSLSQIVYIPFEMNTWASAFEHGIHHHHRISTEDSHQQYNWLEDDRATAQYTAAVCDSALYGVRDGRSSHIDRSSPAYYMSEWAHTLHVNPSMRLSSIAGALPLYSPWNTLGHSLASTTTSTNHNHNVNSESMRSTEGDLWTFMERHPLLPHLHHNKNKCKSEEYANVQHEQFVPLTHSLKFSPNTESGRVLGHTLTLRGVGSLPCIHYPREEALARYALPLCTSTYLPLLTSSGYPVSSTFPHELLSQYTQHNLEHNHFTTESKDNKTKTNNKSSAACAPSTLNVGAHVCTTYGSANYIEQIAHNAHAVFTRRFHVHKDNYYLEFDEWKEQIEEVWQMRDDYKHGEPEDDANS